MSTANGKSKKGLGRTFDSLIPDELLDESFDPTATQDETVSDLRHLRLSDIAPDAQQPRRHFDEAALKELAESVRRHGILQPIVVAPQNGGYVIVAGERRYRAAKLAGLEKIPALVRTVSAQHKLELSLIENLQRRDLNIIETATAYLKLRDQFNLTLDEIGAQVGGKSVSTISNTLRLLRLPVAAKTALVNGTLSEGQARPLINLAPEQLETVLPKIIAEQWSARAIEQYIVDLKTADSHKTKAQGTTPVHRYEADVRQLHHRLRTDVAVRTNTRGAGTITIKFKNDADFQRLKKLLGE